MATIDQTTVTPSAAFQAAGPIMRPDGGHYMSPRDLPVSVKVKENKGDRSITFFMGFRSDAVAGAEGADGALEQFHCHGRDGQLKMTIAFALDRRRVAWVSVFDEELGPETAKLVQGLLQLFREQVGEPLPIPAEATLRLLVEMAPAILRNHTESTRPVGGADGPHGA